MSDKICRIKGCNEEAFTRGVCNNHYHKFYYAIKSGKTSWEVLEKKGLVEIKGALEFEEVDNPLINKNVTGSLNVIGAGGTKVSLFHPQDETKEVSKKDLLLRFKKLLQNSDLDDLVVLVIKD